MQPCGFSPVLGYEGSRWEAGKPQTVAWRLFAAPGDWKASLERLSAEVMQLKDYRRPLGASLTDAALNMIKLIAEIWNLLRGGETDGAGKVELNFCRFFKD